MHRVCWLLLVAACSGDDLPPALNGDCVTPPCRPNNAAAGGAPAPPEPDAGVPVEDAMPPIDVRNELGPDWPF